MKASECRCSLVDLICELKLGTSEVILFRFEDIEVQGKPLIKVNYTFEDLVQLVVISQNLFEEIKDCEQ